MTATTTAQTAPTAVALPELLTIDDIYAGPVDGQPGAWRTREAQVILIATEPDTDLYEGAQRAWNIFLIQGKTTLLIGNVQDVRHSRWTGEFVGQFVDHEQEDLFIADCLRTRDGAVRCAVRHYFSAIALQERRARYAGRVRRLAQAPSRCQIDHCADTRGVAHVIIDERVWDACEYCRRECGLEVATAA